MNDLFKSLSEENAFKELTQAIALEKTIAVYDMPLQERCFLACALSERLNRQVLFILPNERLARQASEICSRLLPERSALFEDGEIQFYHAVAGRDLDWQRLNVLYRAKTGLIRVLVCSAEALMSRLSSPSAFEQACFVVGCGEENSPQALADELLDLAYERVDMVEARGQFALRGDILDLYPPCEDSPVRLEFFDDQVDTLRSFDPLSQKSIAQMESLLITPSCEHYLPKMDREQAKAELQKLYETRKATELNSVSPNKALPKLKKGLDQLEKFGGFPGFSLWYPLLSLANASLLDWLDHPLVVLDTPDRAMQRLSDREKGFQELLTRALERQEALPEQIGLLRGAEESRALLQKRPILLSLELLTGLANFEPAQCLPLTGKAIKNYRAQGKDLSRDLKDWLEAGFKVCLFTGSESRMERLAQSLKEDGVRLESKETRGVRLFAKGLSDGFVWEGGKLVLVGENDLYYSARGKQGQAKTSGKRLQAFTDLKTGDYVVHEHHGIGLYKGTVRLQSEGSWQDYLLIQYKGNDKLYLPSDQFDRIQKYIGSAGEAPPINDLSSGDWEKQKSRVKSGLQKLAFDLVALYAKRQATPGYSFEAYTPWENQFGDQFDYDLTPDQEQAVADVFQDMESPQNMDRLLCGDVGYGKTEVALRAAFRAVMNGKQVALLAPTTILVQQHYLNFCKRFEGFSVKVSYLSRFQSAKDNQEVLKKAKTGEADILIGTHRLLSDDVHFKDLGLLIIDEEQRFGVKHKENIKRFKTKVDVLTMSATPIPRTLHMSLVGVRDMSILETPPENRYPVSSYVVDYDDGLVRDVVMREMKRGGQVFFLYNRVSSMEKMASKLRQMIPEADVAIAHGQMSEEKLENVMMDFIAGRHDILLCSTIVENGIDIPNANTLIVYDADCFGLSQLYQLRGRIGRSNRSAYAYFTVKPEKVITESAEKRLSAIKEFTEFGAGFRIAMRDLEIRGAGNIFGPEQSGQVSVVGYDLYCKMIEEAVRAAQGDLSLLNESELETRVDWKINAFLPDNYIKGEAQRIEIYKRIADIKTGEAQMELVDELIDRFGDPPLEVIHLTELSLMKNLANSIGIRFVSFKEGMISFKLDERFSPELQPLLYAILKTDQRLKLNRLRLGAEILLGLSGTEAPEALKIGIKTLDTLKKELSLLTDEKA